MITENDTGARGQIFLTTDLDANIAGKAQPQHR
jgi:hypothetical protein